MLYPLKYLSYGAGVSLKDLQSEEETSFINLNLVESVSAITSLSAHPDLRFAEVKMAVSTSCRYFVSESEAVALMLKIGLTK